LSVIRVRTIAPEHVDVLIVGAGLSGIGAACHLQRRCPSKSYTILEARDSIGGTWDLFRYPGIRSDSDMHTLGYSFRPWKAAKSIADGPSILSYIKETAEEYGVTDRIRFGHRVVDADWSSEEMRWNVTAERTDGGERVQLSAGWLMFCSGYYSYEQGYQPEIPGTDRFQGPIVHPQRWPEDLDYAGKRVVVIGSGATAITLVPAMAEKAAHVTMLQRSPSYVVSLPAEDAIAGLLRRVLPPMAAYQAVRFKNVGLMALSYQLSRRRPQLMKALIRKGILGQLPEEFEVDTHFSPRYDPWDQRLCVCPDGDLFQALSDGGASIVTDTIGTVTERGVLLESGDELAADVIVTATGLNLVAFGGVQLAVDGEAVELPDQMVYKGTMLSGVPNAAMAIGYTNASWTLKCDLTCEYACRVLNHMDRHGYKQVVAVRGDPSVTPEPLLNLNSGYVLRALDRFPQQGSRRPWKMYQNYAFDVLALRLGELDDGVLRFSRVPAPAERVDEVPAAA
jgi:cation diffusion facilitator CzcD-associated flavoprotein CzcO